MDSYNKIEVVRNNNGWIVICYKYITESYLYYSKREAEQRFRIKHNLSNKHLR